MTDSLRKSVRRHAVTAQLLGADSIPAYPSKRARPAAPEEALPPAPEAVVAPPSAIFVEPKPKATREEREALLAQLRAVYESDAPHKQFVTAFTNIVFGDGDPAARLMFVGEAPGAEEDRTGKPFVGRAGELLNKMITAMGLKREDVYIANVLKTRPPDNATPTSFEIDLCRPYLMNQIEIVGPEVVVALGLPASRALLRNDESMGSMRGRWHSVTLPTGAQLAVMPTYHPAYVLRNYTDETRAKVWSDLKMAMDRLGLAAPSGTKS